MLQVFVSSTVREFRDLRSALSHWLRSMGFTVQISEAADFDVRGDRSAIDECLTNVRKSDYFILLVGGARGSLFDDENQVSVTQQELRTARESFLQSGRPKILMFLREEVELTLKTGASDQSAVQDRDHLFKFIEELEKPAQLGVPNYLKRFRDFEDLAKSISPQLNIGRTIEETLIRHALASELSANIARMATRLKNSIWLPHWAMKGVRNEIQLSVEDSSKLITLNAKQGKRLALALPQKVRGTSLSVSVCQEALRKGVFLSFNVTKGAFEGSPIHDALLQLNDDVDSLIGLGNSQGSSIPDWDFELLGKIKITDNWTISGHTLAMAFAYYDRVENVFNDHLALLNYLLGHGDDIEKIQRRPSTPYGEEEEKRLASERVSGAEVLRLAENDIWPLGPRIISAAFGPTREAQIKTIIEGFERTLAAAGLSQEDAETRAILEEAASSFLEKFSAPPEEGLSG